METKRNARASPDRRGGIERSDDDGEVYLDSARNTACSVRMVGQMVSRP